MSRNDYVHPRGRTVKGHKGDCKYTNYGGEPCECEDLSLEELHSTMLLMGWEHDARTTKGRSFLRFYDPHYIGVCHLIDGWQFRWERGPGSTLVEERGFGTISALMTFIWGTMAQDKDLSMKTSWEWGQMRQQLKDANIEPRELGKKPKPRPPAVKSTLKHEVTDFMADLEHPEDYGAGRGGG